MESDTVHNCPLQHLSFASRDTGELVSLRTSSSDTPTPAWKDEDLVQECLRGNEYAWAAVVDKYKGLVYAAPIKYRMTPQDAADVFQEVWLDLYTELGHLRKPAALGGWLNSVASHKCFQWKRGRTQVAEQQAGEFTEPVAMEVPFPEWKEHEERQQLLRDTVEQLPERCRRMVQMLFYRDPPVAYAEVARQLGLAEGSIGFIRGRCLDRLRTVLQQQGF
jgi:RNA polymerase sigma factor (sigma-70 family)